MIIQITIPDGDAADIMTEVAALNNTDLTTYVTNMVVSMAAAQLRARYIDAVTNKPLAKIKAILGSYKNLNTL